MTAPLSAGMSPASGTTSCAPGLRSAAGRFRIEFAVIAVCTIIGQSTLTPMPWGRTSRCSDSVNPTTANLDAQ
jgi:hypothetical protein